MPQESARSAQTNLPARIQDYTPEAYNVLYPSQQALTLSPLQVVTPEVVKIDPNPDNKEVFKIGSRKVDGGYVDEYALTKIGLNKIAHAAGIVFDPATTKRADDTKNPRRVEFTATGAIKKPDGSWYPVTASKEVDLDVIEKETRMNLDDMAKDGKLVEWVGKGNKKVFVYKTKECDEEIEKRVATKMIQVEKHKVAIADTGARNRVIRALIAAKGAYTAVELSKPFVVPHVGLNTEFLLADPETRRMIIRQSLESQNMIFGRPQIAAQTQTALLAPANDDDTIDDLEPRDEAVQVVEEKPKVVEPPKPTEAEYKQSWLTNTPDERKKEMNRLLELKGEAWLFEIKYEDITPQRQVDALWHYTNLPDKPKTAPLPWEKGGAQ
jgi:hypothetical protein